MLQKFTALPESWNPDENNPKLSRQQHKTMRQVLSQNRRNQKAPVEPVEVEAQPANLVGEKWSCSLERDLEVESSKNVILTGLRRQQR